MPIYSTVESHIPQLIFHSCNCNLPFSNWAAFFHFVHSFNLFLSSQLHRRSKRKSNMFFLFWKDFITSLVPVEISRKSPYRVEETPHRFVSWRDTHRPNIALKIVPTAVSKHLTVLLVGGTCTAVPILPMPIPQICLNLALAFFKFDWKMHLF